MKFLIYRFLLLFRKKTIKSRPENCNLPLNPTSFYDFKLKLITGEEIDFNIFKGKKVMVVNTASACGYTPQYKELQLLYEKYKDTLIILGFPSNNFGAQEPASNGDIFAFCTKNYGVSFPLYEKSDVKGSAKNPLYKWLTDKNQNGWNSQFPDWNFCKYLINEKGELMKFYSSSVAPFDNEILSKIL